MCHGAEKETFTNLVMHLRGRILPDTNPRELLEERMAGLICTCSQKPQPKPKVETKKAEGNEEEKKEVEGTDASEEASEEAAEKAAEEEELSALESHCYYNQLHNST